MSKRDYQTAFSASDLKRQADIRRQPVKKHTLDSDEEDEVDEDNILDADDIEGEEDGSARQDGEQKMTAFNMNEEMEEGHFDKQGHFIWNNEKEIRDSWLDNIDWQKIKTSEKSKGKYNIGARGLGDSDSDDDDLSRDLFDEISTYRKIMDYLKPKETIAKALKRLGGGEKLSSVERLKRKKAGTLNSCEEVTKLTELSNLILTKLGNMDVYQETYEQIKFKIDSYERKNKVAVKDVQLDMYSDDFDSKEREKIGPSGQSSADVSNEKDESGASGERKELMWEFKWKIEDEKVNGPFSTAQMIKWSKDKYFKTGVMVRKCGELSNFYTSNRIDFELYE